MVCGRGSVGEPNLGPGEGADRWQMMILPNPIGWIKFLSRSSRRTCSALSRRGWAGHIDQRIGKGGDAQTDTVGDQGLEYLKRDRNSATLQKA